EQVLIPLRKRSGLVVSDAVSLDLSLSEASRDMDRDLLQTKFQCGLVARVADDDDAFFVDHDRLAEAEFSDRSNDRRDCRVVQAGVLFIGSNAGNETQLDLHGLIPLC